MPRQLLRPRLRHAAHRDFLGRRPVGADIPALAASWRRAGPCRRSGCLPGGCGQAQEAAAGCRA
eukprot:9512252-Alexandrium_andersonii.AAC.1